MSLQVLYTPRAKETLSSVYNFINTDFGVKAADKFVLKTEKIITLISQYPSMFKSAAFDENVRIGIISKQISLFYRVTNTAVHLLFFWDNRQEPFLHQ